jgi:hypothetical protein
MLALCNHGATMVNTYSQTRPNLTGFQHLQTKMNLNYI